MSRHHDASAKANCALPGLTPGNRVSMTQYISGGLDYNYSCGWPAWRNIPAAAVVDASVPAPGTRRRLDPVAYPEFWSEHCSATKGRPFP